ncbi:DNA primase [Tropicibacter naphthalenivorans]|uniref:DNA primase n=1 Tax=Tropicibacter naphthalenivorans TaxID=441103 RepID=A0A0P1G887_9RHOB|nr:DNA primase [Tropicibacter naphthalenivorans]CUH77851.1 DNA primase [Tropicibacter naphthalenivorans]SMC95734.1 DNA primase [Tropicibacter naphthalenivorans]
MSLPPGFLDELRTRTSLTQVVGRKVMFDMRKSNQGKGDMWGPCPFHHEKTASFHVDDRKGYYYCFGCHAKGDAISFVRETENVSFMEAVEILAQEAGMPVPKQDPRAQQKADRRSLLSEVMEQAVQFFRLELKRGPAQEARAYLAKRGLSQEALDRFEIGFAPPGWENLREHLKQKGVDPELMLAAGLVKKSDKGREPYDVFRHRIMFPIRDGRGRAIAFGGRAMDPNDNAKYLNSPETELFDKSRNLYNMRAAREASGKGNRLIVAEGYMDVIALSEAGFPASVAPLGTAVTEPQLQLMWRMSEEPVIALDGDTAGLRAAYRVIDIALPVLEAGKGLRFAIMPEGKDPDDLLRAEGPEAVSKVLDEAMPMVKLLWRQETEGKVFDSPERKAALDKVLRARIAKIQDPYLRRHYGDEIKELRYALFRPQRAPFKPGGGFGGGFNGGKRRDWRAPLPASPTAKQSLLASAGDDAELMLREMVIFAAILRTPQIAEEFESQLETMPCRDADHATLRDVILRAIGNEDRMIDMAEGAIGPDALETLFAARHVAIVPCIRSPGNIVQSRKTVAEELAKLEAHLGWKAELAEAEQDLDELADEALTYRVGEAAKARAQAGRLVDEDDAEYEIGPNGASVDRNEKNALDSLISQIWSSKGSD